MNDLAVSELLDAYAPAAVPDDSDWEDVLRRAEPASSPRRSRRRRLLVLAAAGVLLLVLLATPAFGLRQALLDLVGREDVSLERSEPTPHVVERRLRRARDRGAGEHGCRARCRAKRDA